MAPRCDMEPLYHGKVWAKLAFCLVFQHYALAHDMITHVLYINMF